MRRIALAGMAIASLAAPAQAQVAPAEWGMSPAEVVAAVDGAVNVRDEKDKRIHDMRNLVDAELEIEGVTHEVAYFFDKRRKTLVAVNFVPPKPDCDATRTRLQAALGEGEDVAKQPDLGRDGPRFVVEDREWDNPDTSGRISFVSVTIGENIAHCQILYER